MRIFKKYTVYALAGMLSAGALSSCSESTMDEINSNNNYPLSADAKFIVTDLGVSTGFNVVGGDLSLYSSVYMEHEIGVHNQMYRAEIRSGEPVSSTTYNNVWGSAYTNIRNAKAVIKKCSPGGLEEGSNVTLGIAKVFLAYNAAILTDLFGDVPYTEAGESDENWLPVYRQPKVDKQEYIYTQILAGLDEAIALFDEDGDGVADGEDTGIFGAVGGKDFIYGGSVEHWLKAANALKARYTMRLMNKSSNVNADLNNILDYIDNAFTSADEEFKLAVYDGDNQVNPLAAFSYSRDALAASASYAKKLKERNDPRYSIVITSPAGKVVADPLAKDMAPNGKPEQLQSYYNIYTIDYAWDAPTQLMSYHELLFLKAEAYARLGDAPNAKTALKEAIAAGFANLESSIKSAGYKADLSEDVSDAYFTSDVEALFDADPLKEIMNQKYLAFMGASGESIEAYNDYRRMLGANENFVTLENAKNSEGKFPHRFVYGNSDALANPNIGSLVGDGSYVYREKVWWAGEVN